MQNVAKKKTLRGNPRGGSSKQRGFHFCWLNVICSLWLSVPSFLLLLNRGNIFGELGGITIEDVLPGDMITLSQVFPIPGPQAEPCDHGQSWWTSGCPPGICEHGHLGVMIWPHLNSQKTHEVASWSPPVNEAKLLLLLLFFYYLIN